MRTNERLLRVLAPGLLVALATGLTPHKSVAQEGGPPALLDPLPSTYQKRLDDFEQRLWLERLANPSFFEPREGEATLHSVALPEAYRWPLDGLVTVGFLGGSDFLRARIEAVAREWIEGEEITLQLSFKDDSGDFREWSREDIDYKAHIRIAFDLDGYWSVVGNASLIRDIAGPHEASMSLEAFAENLPEEWDVLVLHEFGHALGFEHEHQHPGARCAAEMKWLPDDQYEHSTDSYGTVVPDSKVRSPGVLAHFGGPPNKWSPEESRRNIETLKATVLTTEFDKYSVMKYYFPDWLFIYGRSSDCFNEANRFLSEGDKNGMLCFYSGSPPGDCPEEAELTSRITTVPPMDEQSMELRLEGLRGAFSGSLYDTLLDFEQAMQDMVPKVFALDLPGPAASRGCEHPPEKLIVLRHACRENEFSQDSPLSGRGQEQADRLANDLSEYGLDAIVVTPKRRTQQTAAPLAERANLRPRIFADTQGGVEKMLAAICSPPAGKTVLYVGHSYTLDLVFAAFGLPDFPLDFAEAWEISFGSGSPVPKRIELRTAEPGGCTGRASRAGERQQR